MGDERKMTSSGGKQQVEVSDEEAFMFAMQLAGASALPMVLKSALELGILDTIARAGHGATACLSSHEIASRVTSIKNPQAPALLDRLLRLLVSFNILTLTPASASDDHHNKYGLAPLAKYFVHDQDGVSMAAPFLMQHDKILKDMWYHLTESIREGGLPFENCYGMTLFEFHGGDERINEIFNKAMGDQTTIVMRKVVERYRGFEDIASLVDVGGGTGAAISMIASKYPNITTAINFDLPHVVEHAPSYPRVRHVAGDMFVSVPKADAVFMKWICHDWNDEDCVKFLNKCHESVGERGKVIVVECIVPEVVDSSSEARCVSQMDAIIMCHSSGGRERTERQYEALAKAAGFQGFRVAASAYNMHIMEFLP